MALCLKKIEKSISQMDEMYDANFGEWIRNEDNCKIVGSNLKRYIEKYKISEFITVVKWIVKDWTLKSIILFSKKLILDDLFTKTSEEYTRRIKIISGFIYTWNPIFISEFLMATAVDLTIEKRADFFVGIMSVFETKKLSEILSQIEGKTDQEMKNVLVKRFKDSIYQPTNDKWKRTSSLVDAFNLI